MIRIAVLATLALTAFGLGFLARHFEAFPTPQLQALKAAAKGSEAAMNTEYVLTRIPGISGERYEGLQTKADVVMLGDSITASGRWAEYFPETSIINRGANGDRVGGALERINQVLAAEPKRVFVMVGINDVRWRNTNAQIVERYRRIVAALSDAGIEVFVQSVIPCRIDPNGPCTLRMQGQIAALNPLLMEMAKELGAVYVALDEEVSGPGGVRPDYSLDGIHFSSAGFAKWSTVIRPLVEGQRLEETEA